LGPGFSGEIDIEANRTGDCRLSGYVELCDKHVDEVVFAGTRNSMSNQEIPGKIPHQLRGGIRALLLTFTTASPGGARIKTDTSSEPMMDNRGGDAGSLFLVNNWVETTPLRSRPMRQLSTPIPSCSHARRNANKRGATFLTSSRSIFIALEI
jgi:hypothetical protein